MSALCSVRSAQVQRAGRCGGLTLFPQLQERTETIRDLDRMSNMRYLTLRLSAIGLISLIVGGAYFEYGQPGALIAIGALSFILVAVWIDRTA